jgi:hypothetical protein
MKQTRNSIRLFDGKPEGNISLERSVHRWEDNIKLEITNRV